MTYNKIYVASKNKHKLEEIRGILNDIDVLEFDSLPDIEETGTTFEENARIKSEFLSKLVDYPVIADDSGICVEALNNAPGVYSARYAGENATDDDNNRKLLKEMDGISNRNCSYACVISLAVGGVEVANFRGEVAGELLNTAQGSGGFGYDPLFMLKDGRVMAEISNDEKNAISHRKKALEQLLIYLKSS